MSDRTALKDLYQEMILDHNRRPRNFHRLDAATCKAEGYNPLCGDRITVYLKMDGDRIEDLSFEGNGCAISKASGSLMTTSLKGRTKREVNQYYERFHQMVTGKGQAALQEELGKLAVFAGVSEFPSRVKCATLAWHTLRSALEGKAEPVSTDREMI